MKRALELLTVVAAAFGLLTSSAWAAGLAYLTGTAQQSPRVWVSNANGSHARKLASGLEAELSPNGRLVAFAVATNNRTGVAIYSSTGKLVLRIIGGAQQAPLTWSPDSRYLAFGASGLNVVDVRTGRATRIASGHIAGVSFAPSAPDRLVYGRSKSLALSSPVNLYTAHANGTHRAQLTRDGHSANPVWGRRGIVFDRVTLRGMNAPVYQLYLLSGRHATQISHVTPPPLQDGLVPLAVSHDGNHLVAAYEGEDTFEAYTVDLNTDTVRQLTDGTRNVSPYGISRNGKRVLVGLGAFENAPSAGEVATMPFHGGSPTVLVKHGADASWNQ